MTATTGQREQYYVFTMPGDELAWCEMYTADGHFVAPMPYGDVQDALDALSDLHPDATVDELCYAADIEECREWARSCPLEPIG